MFVFFKRLGSRHIYKEINSQKVTTGVDKILCKTDLKHIQILAYKYNTFNDVHFEAFKVRLSTIVVFTISLKACFARDDFLLCNDIDLNRLLSE